MTLWHVALLVLGLASLIVSAMAFDRLWHWLVIYSPWRPSYAVVGKALQILLAMVWALAVMGIYYLLW